ncbi:MAG: DedA family protein, partial [Alphaproteobacteria bacterium]
RFAILNFIAAGIWASSFVAAGWFLGALIGPERLGWTIAGIALAALLFFIIRHWRRRATKAKAAEGA